MSVLPIRKPCLRTGKAKDENKIVVEMNLKVRLDEKELKNRIR